MPEQRLSLVEPAVGEAIARFPQVSNRQTRMPALKAQALPSSPSGLMLLNALAEGSGMELLGSPFLALIRGCAAGLALDSDLVLCLLAHPESQACRNDVVPSP